MPVLVLSYKGVSFTFTKERLNDALQTVSRLVAETGGKFSWADAAIVHRMMRDLAWQYDQANDSCYKVRITRWSTGTVVTIAERMSGDKFDALRELSLKYSTQYGCQWEIDVSVISEDEAKKIMDKASINE